MKVGSLFKIDIKYIEEDIKRKKKIIEKYKKSKIETYRTSEIDEKNLIKADYNKLNKESYSSQVKMTIKNTTQASAYVNGAIDIASIASSNINNVKAAWDNVQKFEMLYSIGDSVNSFNSWPIVFLLKNYYLNIWTFLKMPLLLKKLAEIFQNCLLLLLLLLKL